MIKRHLFLIVCIGLLFGCAGSISGSHIIGAGKSMQKIDPNQLNTGNEIYRLAARDVLLIQIDTLENTEENHKIDRGNQLRVGFTQNQNSDYKIAPGDQLSLEFPDEVDAVFDVLVNPDGSVTLPKVGKILKISGMTLSQLSKVSVKQYNNLYLSPKLSWAITRTFNEQLTRMSGDFSVGSEGKIVIPELGDISAIGKTAKEVADTLTAQAQSKFKNDIHASVSVARINAREQVDVRLTPSGLLMYTNLSNLPTRISDEGEVFIPHLGTLPAQGKTVFELKQDILKMAQPLYQNPITVNVSVQEFADYNVFIGGEVRQPGRYPYSQKLSLLKLIAQAGWGNENADLGNVLLLRADKDNHYTIYRTNLDEIFDGAGSSAQDFRVTPQDLVIVPPTGIAKTNRIIAQYVRGVLPFSTSVSYTINNTSSQAR